MKHPLPEDEPLEREDIVETFIHPSPAQILTADGWRPLRKGPA